MSGVRALELGVYRQALDWLADEDRAAAAAVLAEVELGRTLATVTTEETSAEWAPGERGRAEAEEAQRWRDVMRARQRWAAGGCR